MSEPIWARRLIRLVEQKMGRPSPPVSWEWIPFGESDDERIRLPSQEWVDHYHPGDPYVRRFHQSILLHELAHYYTGNEGHTRNMYALFFWMVRWAGLPMRAILREEMIYKPRAARSGYRLYRRQLREGYAEEAA